MISAPLPANEEKRMHRLEELGILDTLEEQAYDDLTHLAAQICNTPIALVSLIDRDRQWFKSHHGLDVRETPREVAFCAHAILGDNLLMIEDSRLDQRFHNNPLATGFPYVRFYAGAPLVLEDNVCIGTLCVIDNVARTLTEAQKEALSALARQVVSQLTLRLKVEELKLLDHAKDEFISMVSHELRTPLTSINGSLSLLTHMGQQLQAPAKEMVDIAYRNTGQLLNIVNDILDLAKMEAGKLEIVRQRIDLQGLLSRAVQLNASYGRQCGCEITLKPVDTASPLMVSADAPRLLQVLGNLISNAAKFTHKGDTIELSAELRGDKAYVSVTDHGAGIPLEYQPLLFQKFKQVAPGGYKKMPGTGLGLNISRHIIELHQGSIACDSTPGQGTTFYFLLPLADS